MDQLTAQNPKSIRDMFGSISEKYDLANSVLSFGIHHRWKKRLVQESHIRPGSRVLDCATGTGDLIFLFESWMKKKGVQGSLIGCDFCEPMLQIARTKGARLSSKGQFECADVTALPYPDQDFDVASISFGIRNVQDTARALSELGRVVKKGGRVLVLEFGQPQSPVIRFGYNLYSQHLLPYLGGWISGQHQAYRYLQTSSSAFPCGEKFLELARSTGYFARSSYLTFQSGIAYLYVLNRE